MENFLKAHTVKKRSPNVQNKNKKLKNKFRLMLSGYERNDTNAIRSALELTSRSDDSDPDFAIDVDSNSESLTPPPVRSSTPSPVQPRRERAVESPTLSRTEADDVSHMMQTINNILNSGSNIDENTSAEVALPDPSIHTVDTSDDFLDTSMDVSNTSSSTFSEFDSNGRLASRILEKLNARDATPCNDQSECEMNTAPSAAGFVAKVKTKSQKKTTSKSKPSQVDTECSIPKIIQNKENCQVSPPLVSVDATKDDLPGFLSLFRQYNYSTSGRIAPKVFHYVADSFFFEINNVKGKINEVDVSDSDSYGSEDSYGNENSYGSEDTYGSEAYGSEEPYGSEAYGSEDSYGSENGVGPQNQEIVTSKHTNSIEEHFVESTNENCDDEMSIEELSAADSVGIKDNSPVENAEIPPATPPPLEIHHLANSCIIVLRHPTEMYLHGIAKVSSLFGTVDIMGYKLQGNSAPIYAPRFSFPHTIKTVATECSQYGLFSKLTARGLSVSTAEDIVVYIGEFDSVIHLEALVDKKMDFVEKEFTTADVFRLSKKQMNEPLPESLSCSLYTDKPYKSFEEIPIWPEVVKCGIGKNSKGIVCGGKGTGKSTFLRYYINSILSQGPVVVIDLDPGQSEFTVAGNISITVVQDAVIGPNFTHLQPSTRMLNLGLINVLDNVERYVSAVTQLLKHASQQDEYRQLPWIVNTMGMSNSIGLKFITYIILLLKPTFLVQMDSTIEKKCFEMLLTSQEIIRVYSEKYEEDEMFENVTCPKDLNFQYYFSSHPKLSGKDNMTAKDKRYLSFLSYFAGGLSRSHDSLLGLRPYTVQLKSLRIATNCKVEEDAITSVINGKIVALCEGSSSGLEKTFTIEENALVCHGHGVIRGVDLDTESLFVITPERREVLSRVNVLVYCDAQPELTAGDAGLAPGTLVPYRAPLRPHNKQLLKSPKRRFNPLQLLKMKKQSRK